MASDRTWKKVSKYFKKNSKIDKWGDVDKISDEFLLALFDFRVYLGCPVYVTSGAKRRGHSKGSWHKSRKTPRGKEVGFCAGDIRVPDYQLTPFDLVMDATRFFSGVGYYPHWRWKGEITGGLHVDRRPLKWDKDKTLNYSHSRWLGILNAEGKQEYIAMTWHNLVKYTKNKKPKIHLTLN